MLNHPFSAMCLVVRKVIVAFIDIPIRICKFAAGPRISHYTLVVWRGTNGLLLTRASQTQFHKHNFTNTISQTQTQSTRPVYGNCRHGRSTCFRDDDDDKPNRERLII